MNSYDFFIYEFICFMNSYMNSGVPRFQMSISNAGVHAHTTYAAPGRHTQALTLSYSSCEPDIMNGPPSSIPVIYHAVTGAWIPGMMISNHCQSAAQAALPLPGPVTVSSHHCKPASKLNVLVAAWQLKLCGTINIKCTNCLFQILPSQRAMLLWEITQAVAHRATGQLKSESWRWPLL